MTGAAAAGRPESWRSASAEAALVALLAAGFYVALQGQLPYHDAARFEADVAADRLLWDIAHILLQPAAVLLRRLSGAAPESVLKMLSSLSTAAAIGLFHLTLLALRRPRWQAALASLVLATCCSVLTLAPSAHPKLVAFPFVNAALLCLCLAELRASAARGLVVAGGLLLALAALFLASALATAPFAGLALILAARRQGAGWGAGFGRMVLLGAVCGLALLTIGALAFVAITGQAPSLAAVGGDVVAKAGLRPVAPPLAVQAARLAFGTVNNLVAAPGLGAVAQAWMRGQIGSLRPYADLLPLLGLWLAMAGLVGAIYLRTAAALLRGRPLLMPAAFLAGAQLWTVWYGLNDPEHWFQLTAPSILLFVLLMPKAVVRLGLPAWAVVAAMANLLLYALPVATYPLAERTAELRRLIGPKDLLLHFADYPGRPYLGFFDLKGVRVLQVDRMLRESKAPVADVLAEIGRQIARTRRDGGRVLVADILDPTDWDAPWMKLLAQGVTRARLDAALLGGGRAERLPDVGGIKLWELHAP